MQSDRKQTHGCMGMGKGLIWRGLEDRVTKGHKETLGYIYYLDCRDGFTRVYTFQDLSN